MAGAPEEYRPHIRPDLYASLYKAAAEVPGRTLPGFINDVLEERLSAATATVRRRLYREALREAARNIHAEGGKLPLDGPEFAGLYRAHEIVCRLIDRSSADDIPDDLPRTGSLPPSPAADCPPGYEPPDLEPIGHAEDGLPVYSRDDVVADAERMADGGGTDVLALRRTT